MKITYYGRSPRIEVGDYWYYPNERHPQWWSRDGKECVAGPVKYRILELLFGGL